MKICTVTARFIPISGGENARKCMTLQGGGENLTGKEAQGGEAIEQREQNMQKLRDKVLAMI